MFFALSTVMGMSLQFSIATVICWALQSNDMVINLNLAHQGWPRMAFTASFSSPVFSEFGIFKIWLYLFKVIYFCSNICISGTTIACRLHQGLSEQLSSQRGIVRGDCVHIFGGGFVLFAPLRHDHQLQDATSLRLPPCGLLSILCGGTDTPRNKKYPPVWRVNCECRSPKNRSIH